MSLAAMQLLRSVITHFNSHYWQPAEATASSWTARTYVTSHHCCFLSFQLCSSAAATVSGVQGAS
eukprot:9182-Heterococcus_DN1.PRE.1